MCHHFTKEGVRYGVEIASDNNLARNRAELAHLFLKTKYDSLLFIDADMLFAPEDAFKLLADDRDIVGATYRKKTISQLDVALCVAANHPELALLVGEQATDLVQPVVADEDGICEANRMATGFLKIRRAVIGDLTGKYPELYYNPSRYGGGSCALFENYFSKNPACPLCYVGDDFGFSMRAKDAGWKLYCDLSLKLGHRGPYIFDNDPEKLLNLRAQLQGEAEEMGLGETALPRL
jgi:hypothetical protein